MIDCIDCDLFRGWVVMNRNLLLLGLLITADRQSYYTGPNRVSETRVYWVYMCPVYTRISDIFVRAGIPYIWIDPSRWFSEFVNKTAKIE